MKTEKINIKVDKLMLIDWLECSLSTNVLEISQLCEQGLSSKVYNVRTNFRDYILKVRLKDENYDVESFFYSGLSHLGILPNVITRTDNLANQFSCILIDYVKGVPVCSLDLAKTVKAQLAADMGKTLKCFHSLPIPYEQFGYGAYLGNAPHYLTWVAFLEATHLCRLSQDYICDKDLLPYRFYKYLKSAIDYCYECDFEPVILHADLSPEHIFLDETYRLTGVIDADNSCIGPLEYDFAYFFMYSDIENIDIAIYTYKGLVNKKLLIALILLIAQTKIYRAHLMGYPEKQDKFVNIIKSINLLYDIF